MACPDCGSATVTVEPGPEFSPTTSVERAVLSAEEGQCVDITQVCWDCGWQETREVCVQRISVETGDETVRQRRELIDAVHGELEDIDSLDTLRTVLDEVERLQQRESG